MSSNIVSDLWGELCLEQESGKPIVYDIVRDDGKRDQEPLTNYFNRKLSQAEMAALSALRAPTLDLGCGPGVCLEYLHTLGIEAFGADSSPGIAQLHQLRRTPRFLSVDLQNLAVFKDNSWGGILLGGNNLGLCGDFAGFTEFIDTCYRKLRNGGTLVGHSLDPNATSNPLNLAYQEQNRARDRYFGTITIHLEHEGRQSTPWNLLLLAPDDAEKAFADAGFRHIRFIKSGSGYFIVAEK